MADTQNLSTYLLRRASRNLSFNPPKLGNRPPTGGLMRSSFVPLTTTAAVAVTTYTASAYATQ